MPELFQTVLELRKITALVEEQPRRPPVEGDVGPYGRRMGQGERKGVGVAVREAVVFTRRSRRQLREPSTGARTKVATDPAARGLGALGRAGAPAESRASAKLPPTG